MFTGLDIPNKLENKMNISEEYLFQIPPPPHHSIKSHMFIVIYLFSNCIIYERGAWTLPLGAFSCVFQHRFPSCIVVFLPLSAMNVRVWSGIPPPIWVDTYGRFSIAIVCNGSFLQESSLFFTYEIITLRDNKIRPFSFQCVFCLLLIVDLMNENVLTVMFARIYVIYM